MIEIKNLNIKYRTEDREVWAVRDLDLRLKENTSYGIVGESGSGKTTLAMSILKLLPENTRVDGEIIYKGKDLNKLSKEEMKAYRWVEMAVVFQESMNSFSPVHRLRTQFEDVCRAHHKNASRKEIKDRALGLFKKFNLDEKLYTAYPHELSGGMLQRVTIVLSLILRPNLLVLDEATTALDVINERQILEEIKNIEREGDLTRINISHDVSVVYTSCDKVIVMYGGYIVELGDVKEVFFKPLHPYTKGLLDSYPDIKDRNTRLQAIPGSLPDLSKEYEGCIYYERCPRRKDICSLAMPDLKEEVGSLYACHNPLGGSHE